MNNCIVKISDDGDVLLGTGFSVGFDEHGTFIATCTHVIQGSEDKLLVNSKKAVVDRTGENGVDLAILYVSGLQLKPLIISSEPNAESVRVIGFTELLANVKLESVDNITTKFDIKIGNIADDAGQNYIALNTAESIQNGYSGAPVICTLTKVVNGIVCIRQDESKAYAISSVHLVDLYPDCLQENKASTNLGIDTDKVRKIDSTAFPLLTQKINDDYSKALRSYPNQPLVWVSPRIHTVREQSVSERDGETEIDLQEIIQGPVSRIMFARQQFGLTSLAHYLVKQSWMNDPTKFWYYIDASQLKPHFKEIEKKVSKELVDYGLSMDDVSCVVLDELSDNIKGAGNILKSVSTIFSSKPVLALITTIDSPLYDELSNALECREFERNYLWGMNRSDVRNIVIEYNKENFIADDENIIVDKVVSDLSGLNVPRTPYNCITLLKIAEHAFDDSPVNRTEMIKRVLYLLFNVDDIPKYKTRPDLKDTEYVLGYYCERMLREDFYYFDRQEFLIDLEKFCNSSEINLEVDVIFDVLFQNGILVCRGQRYCFKFSYWLFYFAAHRMHQNESFEVYVLDNLNYASYPELIEFYTGIDRRRDNALEIFIRDIRDTRKTVESKCGLPEDFDIYQLAKWTPSDDEVKRMQSEISAGVLNSNLPTEIKDEYADRGYLRTRSHYQETNKIIEEYSLQKLMKLVSAGSKALRNSDYALPTLKHELLEEVLAAWNQLIKVLLVVAPALAQDRHVDLDGVYIYLGSGFEQDSNRRFHQILGQIPVNVVNWYREDLFTHRMSSVLEKHCGSELDGLTRHTMNLFLVKTRPNNWEKQIQKYVTSEDKNSFYLMDTYRALRTEYKYSFASKSVLGQIEKLIKMTASKHSFGIKSPNQKAISKVPDSILPKRSV